MFFTMNGRRLKASGVERVGVGTLDTPLGLSCTEGESALRCTDEDTDETVLVRLAGRGWLRDQWFGWVERDARRRWRAAWALARDEGLSGASGLAWYAWEDRPECADIMSILDRARVCFEQRHRVRRRHGRVGPHRFLAGLSFDDASRLGDAFLMIRGRSPRGRLPG